MVDVPTLPIEGQQEFALTMDDLAREALAAG